MSRMPEQSTPVRKLESHVAHSLGLVALALALTFGLAAGLMAQPSADVKGSRDHPMISRVEGSTIRTFSQKDFDDYRLVTGKVNGSDSDGHRWKTLDEALNGKNSLQLQGKVWKLTYLVPKNRSTLEIFRSYQTELAKAGFKTLFQCTNTDCADPLPAPARGRSAVSLDAHAGALSDLLMKRAGLSVFGNISDDQRYLAAHLARAEGDIYVSLLALTVNAPHVRLDVVEVKPSTDLITVDVNAAAMATGISTHGSIALYGIYFDTDRADVKPESRKTLSEIATLLKGNAKLSLIVVGHTDNNGTLDHNLDLSLRRAQAVVAALSSEFAIDRTRLEARGVGFLAPVAANTTEEGRAKNRRVQLLQR